MKYVLYLEKRVHDYWEPYDDCEDFTTVKIIGVFKDFKYPYKIVEKIRQGFVDRLVLDDALEEARYRDHNSYNRIVCVTGLNRDADYYPLDDDKHSYLRIKAWFNVTTENENTHYLYTIQETKEYFGTCK